MTTPRLPMGGYTCEETYTRLAEYRDRVLASDEHDKVAAHLRVCETCAPLAAMFDRLHAVVKAEGATPAPATLWARAAARLEADDALSDLPGTWPVPETEGERIKRLSKFSTRRVSTRDESGDPLPVEAIAEGRALFRWPIEDEVPVAAVLPLSAVESVPVAPRLVKEQQSARVLRARITMLYAAGIAAMVFLAPMVSQIATRLGQPSQPPIVAEVRKPYVEALLTVDLRTYRPLEDPSAAGVEKFMAQYAAWTPVIFPEIGTYESAQVWNADGKQVACAIVEIDGHEAAVMCSPWQAGDPVPGQELLSPTQVESYEFQFGSQGERHIAMWTHTWGDQQMLYSLLVLDPIDDLALQEMALNTLLEIEQRQRELSGQLPG